MSWQADLLKNQKSVFPALIYCIRFDVFDLHSCLVCFDENLMKVVRSKSDVVDENLTYISQIKEQVHKKKVGTGVSSKQKVYTAINLKKLPEERRSQNKKKTKKRIHIIIELTS